MDGLRLVHFSFFSFSIFKKTPILLYTIVAIFDKKEKKKGTGGGLHHRFELCEKERTYRFRFTGKRLTKTFWNPSWRSRRRVF